jgi:predicted signal transduction protein with EAL and GGDEF domain
LSQFPIDKLKLDTGFVRNITSNHEDAAIALAIILMAHSLRLGVVAEGVETAAQLSDLQRKGCDQIQGYYVSTPLPVAELEEMLGNWVGPGRCARTAVVGNNRKPTQRLGKSLPNLDRPTLSSVDSAESERLTY